MNSDVFIEVAKDCPAVRGEVPPVRGGRATKAAIEYELIAGEPYALTEEEVAFRTRVLMRDIPETDWPAERERLLSQEKPRLRVSTLAKRYGWGIHVTRTGALRWWRSSRRSISVSLPTQRSVTFERSAPSAPNRRRRRVDWARSLQRTQGGSLGRRVNVRTMNPAELRNQCLSFTGAEETFPFGPKTSVFKVAGKMFALSQLGADSLRVSLKCEPQLAEALRGAHAAVLPGYHLNKRHWNTVIIDGSLPDDAIRDMIEDSYDLVVSKLPPAGRRALGWRGEPG